MTTLAMVLSGWLVLWVVYQSSFAVWFSWRVRHARLNAIPDEQLPRAAVIMSLRGWDDGLSDTLHSLLQQDYPNYEVTIVVDSVEDPAWGEATRIVNVLEAGGELRASAVQIQPLVERLPTCSLKCSSLVQASQGLENDVELIAFCDADSRPPAWWLRELAGPLQDPRVGLSFGNRWYVPQRPSLGAQVRALWNVTAVVTMDVMGIPWAGSMAVRGDAFRAAQVAERWSHAIVDDTSLRLLLKQRRLRQKFVPTLMHADFDDASLANTLNFVVRQMTWTRLYARDAWLVVWICTVCSLVPLTAAGMVMIAALVTRNGPAAAWSVAGIATYHLLSILSLGMLDRSIHHGLRRQYAGLRWSWRNWLRMSTLAPLAEVLHVPAFLASLCKRRFTWRGVTYQVHSPWDIRIEDFDSLPAPRETQSSTVNL